MSFDRSTNACPFGRVARVYASLPRAPNHIVRFGSRAATSLLLLELTAHDKLTDGWDAEWYVGEFLHCRRRYHRRRSADNAASPSELGAVRGNLLLPWFADASVAKITHVEWPSDDHLYWPELDVDLSVRSIEHPEEFPLKYRGA